MGTTLILWLLFQAAKFSPAAGEPVSQPGIPVYGYRVLQAFPYDREAFTQGLVMADGELYEGTGLNGRSSLRRVELESVAVLQLHALPERYFGEGVTVLDSRNGVTV